MKTNTGGFLGRSKEKSHHSVYQTLNYCMIFISILKVRESTMKLQSGKLLNILGTERKTEINCNISTH